VATIRNFSIGKFGAKKCKINRVNEIENKKDPMLPETVLFGLIFVSIGPLKNLPNINPPISVSIQIIIEKNKNNLNSNVKLNNIKNDENKNK